MTVQRESSQTICAQSTNPSPRSVKLAEGEKSRMIVSVHHRAYQEAELPWTMLWAWCKATALGRNIAQLARLFLSLVVAVGRATRSSNKPASEHGDYYIVGSGRNLLHQTGPNLYPKDFKSEAEQVPFFRSAGLAVFVKKVCGG